jgi:phospholipase/carboxylesterase
MTDVLEAVEVETGPEPRSSIIWLHGLGADGHDFVPIVPELGLPGSQPVRFVFPHAPMRPVTINAGMVMRAWYDVVPDGGQRGADESGVRASQKQIEALIERERRRGSPSSRVVLAGFSQGGAMALHTGLRYQERLAGILALSTFLPLADHVESEASQAHRDVPIFIAHGTYDDLIPIGRGRATRNLLVELGYPVTWREYPVTHSVCAEEIADTGAWLRTVLQPV